MTLKETTDADLTFPISEEMSFMLLNHILLRLRGE